MEFLTQQKLSQGPSRPRQGPNFDYQISSFLQPSIRTFGQTQCSSRICSPRQTSFTTSANMSLICLETSHSSSRSSDCNQQHDSISFELVDGHQWLRTRNCYPSSRSQCIPIYGCQSLWMGSSFRADETILSWSLDGRPVPAPYQYTRNDGHSLRTEKSHNIYSPFLHHDLYRQHDSGLLYQQTRWNTFSQSMYRGMGDPQLVPGTRCSNQSSSYSRQIQYFGRLLLEIGQTYQNRMGIGSNHSEFNIPNAQLSQCGPVCDTIQSQTPIVCISSSRQPCTCSRRSFNELESTSCICISSYKSDIFCSSQDTSVSVQNSSHCSILASMAMVLRGTTTTSVRSNSSSTISNLLTQSKGKFLHQNLPLLDLHAWELSKNQSEIKSFRKSLQKWVVYSNWGHRKNVNPFSAPETVLAHFLIYLPFL